MFHAADSEVLFLRIGALAILTAAIVGLLLCDRIPRIPRRLRLKPGTVNRRPTRLRQPNMEHL